MASLALLLISLLVSAAVLFAAGEVAFRLRYGDLPPGPPNAAWYRFDEKRGWALVPGRYEFFHFGSFRPVLAEINAQGLRNPPLQAVPEPGRRRITVIGDSFTFAEALTRGERFTDRLQALLGTDSEVVNVSVPGYGTGQELLLLEELAATGFQPGAELVLQFFTNDLQDNLGLDYSSLDRDPTRPAFSLAADGSLSIDPPHTVAMVRQTSSLIDSSLFYRFLRFRAELLATSYPALLRPLAALGLVPDFERFPGVVAGWYGEGWEARWRHTRKVLAAFITWVRERFPGTRLHIAFIPSPLQVEGVFKEMVERKRGEDPRFESFLEDIDRPQRLLAAFCAQQEVGLIDATAALQAADLPYFPREGHLSEQGSAIVARLLQEAVEAPRP